MDGKYPKISDDELKYFQFKAKQLCARMQENEAWLAHCSEVHQEDCSQCLVKREDSQSVKTVGIQVTPKLPTSTNISSLKTKSEKEAALEDLRARLENIELEMEKIYETSLQHAKKKLCEGVIKVPACLSPEQKEIFIKASLRSSLEKIDSLLPDKVKKSVRPIKSANSGYILPHELQKGRESSRKAYLASLEVSNAKNQEALVGNATTEYTTVTKKSATKFVLSKAPLKKGIKTKINRKKLPVVENTLVKSTEDEEIKDPNIELVVDGILDDLLREAVVDLNRIKLVGNTPHFIKPTDRIDQTDPNEQKKKSSYSTAENTHPKMLYSIDSAQLLEYKHLLERNKLKSRNFPKSGERIVASRNPETLKQTNKESLEACAKLLKPEGTLLNHTSPKFMCGISHIISLKPNEAKDIAQHTEEFWKYLTRINRVVVGNFHPWAFCNAVADSIVDDCINDIAAELCNVPSALIKFLYNQEFLQQVDPQH